MTLGHVTDKTVEVQGNKDGVLTGSTESVYVRQECSMGESAASSLEASSPKPCFLDKLRAMPLLALGFTKPSSPESIHSDFGVIVFSTAATTASINSPRTLPILLLSRVGWTRLVNSTT